jgi:hypothetical protein
VYPTAQTILLAAIIKPKEVAVSNWKQTVRQQELPIVTRTHEWEKVLNPVREKIVELVAALIMSWEKEIKEGKNRQGGCND